MKKIFDAFANPTDAQRTFREILFLQAFSGHENVVQLLNVIKAKNDRDIYLVFEFMGECHIKITINSFIVAVHRKEFVRIPYSGKFSMVHIFF